MKLLRRTIRKILQESMSHEDKIIAMMLADGPSLKQALSLAESLDIIRQHEDKPFTLDLQHHVLATFVCSIDFFKALSKAGGSRYSPVANVINDTEVAVMLKLPEYPTDIPLMRKMMRDKNKS